MRSSLTFTALLAFRLIGRQNKETKRQKGNILTAVHRSPSERQFLSSINSDVFHRLVSCDKTTFLIGDESSQRAWSGDPNPTAHLHYGDSRTAGTPTGPPTGPPALRDELTAAEARTSEISAKDQCGTRNVLPPTGFLTKSRCHTYVPPWKQTVRRIISIPCLCDFSKMNLMIPCLWR